ncbi:hypothetical protein [Actinoplanes sp. N902-109]|uniref:hypothetical protein n=1 Tax=Actinoplanes sp. (strain N902-109) TaxID=649831 RepID=UPI0003296671|nr:hypothetical protein [Actinoplanes sp. N902-109]AGL19295.1 hypothetical protein L083_5785 [Actinoplanes sp. N902-109]
MAESNFHFGTMNFHGGQQNFGDHNTNTQHAGTPAEQVREQLTAILAGHPDGPYARSSVAAIEGDIAEGSPQARARVRDRLRQLADTAGDARTVAEAAAAIGAIVAAQWPF